MKEHEMCCIVCGNKNEPEIVVIEHRNDFMDVAALIFVCANCIDRVSGRETEIRFGIPEISKETLN